MIRQLISQLIDLLYPRICSGCGRVGHAFCASCTDELCAAAPDCVRRTLDGGMEVIASGLHHGRLRNAIHAYKFNSARELKQILGFALVQALAHAQVGADVIVPVPLHVSRERWRGFNQAELLGNVLADESGIPCVPLLRRTRRTGAQVGRSAAERWAAVRGAFIADQAVSGQRVLLVDDVVTTGATLIACADALYAAGAASVLAACVASA